MIYENISALCKKKGLTIRQLEIKAGLSNGTVGKWKTAEYPRYSSLNSVAKVLGVSVATLTKEKNASNN